MARPDFTNRKKALESALLHTGGNGEKKLEELLDLTSGTSNTSVDGVNKTATVFRPYYAAARWLSQNFNHIVKTSGVVGAQKVDPSVAVADLMAMQAAEDARLKVTGIEGYEALAATLPADDFTFAFPGVAR